MKVGDKVRITKCENGGWYRDCIGQEFTVDAVGGEYLYLNSGRVHISDCELVEDKWIPKRGETILVKDEYREQWFKRKFFATDNGIFVCYSDNGKDYKPWKYAEPLSKEPEVKYRPFKSGEMDSLIGKVVMKSISGDGNKWMIVGIELHTQILIAGHEESIQPSDLLSTYTFVDGSPCGVKE